MPIVFEGEPLVALAADSEPTLDGVILTVTVFDDSAQSSVPVRILLEPEDAAGLCPRLSVQAGVVAQWRRAALKQRVERE